MSIGISLCGHCRYKFLQFLACGYEKRDQAGREEIVALHCPWAPCSLFSYCKGIIEWHSYSQSTWPYEKTQEHSQADRKHGHSLYSLGAMANTQTRTFIKLIAVGAGTLRTGVSILGARFWAWISLGYWCSPQWHTWSHTQRSQSPIKQGSAHAQIQPIAIFVNKSVIWT